MTGPAAEPATDEPAPAEPPGSEAEAGEPAAGAAAEEEALAAATSTMPLAPVVPLLPGLPPRQDGAAVPTAPGAARVPEAAAERPRLAAPRLTALLAGLSADPRLPGWIRRAVGSVAACTLLAVLLNWWFGVAAGLLAAAVDALYSYRASAVVPAAVRAASAARRTRRRLDRVVPDGYLVLHTRLVPGSGSVLDHLVVGPVGVYAVTSQRWDRRLPVRCSHGDRLFHGPYDQSGVLDQARRLASRAAGLIGDAFGQQVAVRPAMVIHGPLVPWSEVAIGGVDVFGGRRLRKYLRRGTSATLTRRLDERQIELIHAVAAHVLPPAK